MSAKFRANAAMTALEPRPHWKVFEHRLAAAERHGARAEAVIVHQVRARESLRNL